MEGKRFENAEGNLTLSERIVTHGMQRYKLLNKVKNDLYGGIEVRESNISGRGVFAIRTFEPGDIVLRWSPLCEVPRDQVVTLPYSERHFLMPISEERFFLMGEPERFVNHSCNPNTKPEGAADVAIRRIEIGEEITSSYFSGNSIVSFTCSCGASNCRSADKRS